MIFIKKYISLDIGYYAGFKRIQSLAAGNLNVFLSQILAVSLRPQISNLNN